MWSGFNLLLVSIRVGVFLWSYLTHRSPHLHIKDLTVLLELVVNLNALEH